MTNNIQTLRKVVARNVAAHRAYPSPVQRGLSETGCAAPSPPYKAAQAPPMDKGTVYIYRTCKAAGNPLSFTVNANDLPLAKLSSGDCFVHYAAPGELKLTAHTEAKTSLTLHVKAGRAYYVRAIVGLGGFAGRPLLMLVSSEVGEEEIAGCKLVPGEPEDMPVAASADPRKK